MCTSYFIEPVQWMEQAMLGVMDGQVTVSYFLRIQLYSIVKRFSDRTDDSEVCYLSIVFSGTLFCVLLHLAAVSQV